LRYLLFALFVYVVWRLSKSFWEGYKSADSPLRTSGPGRKKKFDANNAEEIDYEEVD